MMVAYYLMCSYAYYERDSPIVSDAFFDDMAKRLLAEYDTLTHWHKKYVTKDMLRAGTYSGSYPPIVEGALDSLLMKFGIR